MNLRPLTPEILHTCSKTTYCRDCPFRIGCKLRYEFYLTTDMESEIQIQVIEMKMNKVLNIENSKITEDKIFKAADHLRQKIRDEKTIHPYFSYI